jgi:thiol-disulfide isomerase/thioredoxin
MNAKPMPDIPNPDPALEAVPPVHPARPPNRVWIWLAGMVLIVAGLGYQALRSNRIAPARAASASALTPDKLRRKAPDFALKDANGNVVRLSDFHGKVVLVDFWATWCGPCKIEIPWFINFERQYKDKGFAIIGTAMDEEGWTVVKPFLSFMKINYRVVLGNDALADQYGIEAFPTTFLIDRDGNIAATHIGLSPKDDFEDGIVQLLQTRPGTGVPAVLVGAK